MRLRSEIRKLNIQIKLNEIWKDVDIIENIFVRPKEKFDDEIINIIAENKNIRIEKIISDGHTTDWYDQDQNEFVCLLSGEAEIEFINNNGENSIKILNCGDCLVIYKHERHRIIKQGKCNWLCVFYD